MLEKEDVKNQINKNKRRDSWYRLCTEVNSRNHSINLKFGVTRSLPPSWNPPPPSLESLSENSLLLVPSKEKRERKNQAKKITFVHSFSLENKRNGR